MTRQQRWKCEMFVRVRDFGAGRPDLFPESSRAGEAFGRVASALAAIDAHQSDHLLGNARMREVKASRREAVYQHIRTIAGAGRQVTEVEPEANPFRRPRNRGLLLDLSTARSFIREAGKREGAFVHFGLPATYLDEFRAEVEALQRASDARISSKTVRREATAGIRAALAGGMRAVRVLDVLVPVATRQDPVALDTWISVRRVDRRRVKAGAEKDATVAPPANAPEAAPPVEVPAPPGTEVGKAA